MTRPATADPAALPLAPLGPEPAQRIFRALLDALARPGTVRSLPVAAAGELPAALLPVLALADLDTPTCVLGGPDAGGWAGAVATATTAPPAPLAAARLITALRPMSAEELAAAPRGSAAAPEEGALIVLAVAGLTGGPPLRLAGPGVAGEHTVTPRDLPAPLLAARRAAVACFPAGVDLVLVAADGQLMGLPRSTSIRMSDDPPAVGEQRGQREQEER